MIKATGEQPDDETQKVRPRSAPRPGAPLAVEQGCAILWHTDVPVHLKLAEPCIPGSFLGFPTLA